MMQAIRVLVICAFLTMAKARSYGYGQHHSNDYRQRQSNDYGNGRSYGPLPTSVSPLYSNYFSYYENSAPVPVKHEVIRIHYDLDDLALNPPAASGFRSASALPIRSNKAQSKSAPIPTPTKPALLPVVRSNHRENHDIPTVQIVHPKAKGQPTVQTVHTEVNGKPAVHTVHTEIHGRTAIHTVNTTVNGRNHVHTVHTLTNATGHPVTIHRELSSTEELSTPTPVISSTKAPIAPVPVISSTKAPIATVPVHPHPSRAPVSPPSPTPFIPTLRFDEEILEGRYHSYEFLTANGIHQKDNTSIQYLPAYERDVYHQEGQEGHHGYSNQHNYGYENEKRGRAIITKVGSYSYTSPEGKFIEVSYVADKDGYHPVGDVLPTPPSIPQAVNHWDTRTHIEEPVRKPLRETIMLKNAAEEQAVKAAESVHAAHAGVSAHAEEAAKAAHAGVSAHAEEAAKAAHSGVSAHAEEAAKAARAFLIK